MKLSAYLVQALREALKSGGWRKWGRVDFWPLTFLDRKGRRMLTIMRVETSVHSIVEHPVQPPKPEEPPKAIDL